MINKVTNTQCRSKFFFLLLNNALQKLKQFPFRNFKRFFFTSNSFFNGFRRRGWNRTFGARPVGKMNTAFCLLCQDAHIFSREVRCQYFGWNRHLMSSGQELTSKSSLSWQDSRWVLSLACTCLFRMSSSS